MKTAMHTLLVLITVALAGCGAAEESPSITPATHQDSAPAPMKIATDGPYHPDGTLRSGDETLGAPTPRSLLSLDGDKGMAGYESPDSYRKVVAFYEGELDDSWETHHGDGGARFTSQDGSARIYVQKPRRGERRARVFYFGEGTPPHLPTQKPSAAAGSPDGNDIPPGEESTPPAAENSVYDKQPGTRNGRDVVIYSPKDTKPKETPRESRSDRRTQPYNPFAGASVRIPVPKNALH